MVEAASSAIPMPTSSDDLVRSRELSALIEALDRDHGSVVVVHGRRGVGKGRLLEDLVRHAAHRPDIAVFEGRTPQAGRHSFHPFAEIAHQAIVWAETHAATESLVDPLYDDLAVVLDRAAKDFETAPSLDQKLRFFGSLARVLTGIGERARLLVVVHDLERADSDTFDLASYLAEELFGDPALDPKNARAGLLVFCMRDDQKEAARARDFLAEALESRTTKTLHLEGLDLEGLRRYVQSPRVLEKLLSASKGLPQEIDALIDSLPTNVEELFERRLNALGATARASLQALAIAGRPASARTIAEVIGEPLKAVGEALADLRDARVLERKIANGEFHFSFLRRSDLEVAERAMPSDLRARWHASWASLLARDGDERNLALLVHHALLSSEPARGVPLAIQAAEAHAVAGAFDAAVQILEQARTHASADSLRSILSRLVELAPLLGTPRAALRYLDEWKAQLSETELGVALHREAVLHNAAGDYDLALRAIDAARSATPEAEIIGRAAIEATASEAYYHLGALEKATQAGEAGLALLASLGSDAPAGASVELLNLLGKAALAGDRAERAIDLFERTLQIAERSGLAREEARAHVNLGYAAMRLGTAPEAEAHLISGIEKAERANDLSNLAFGHMNLGVLLHQRGELGRAIEYYSECRSLFRRLGNRTQVARVLHNLANLYLVCGDLVRARAHNDEALRISRASGVERLVAIATALDGLIASETGDRATAEARLREAMALHGRLGVERPIETMLELAEVQLRFGDTERADETMREVEDALRTIESKLLHARACVLRGRIALARGDGDPTPISREARDTIATLGRRLPLRDAEVALAGATSAAGQREAARMHYARALEIQRVVANELPEDLRALFEAARPQAEIEAAVHALEGDDTKVDDPVRLRVGRAQPEAAHGKADASSSAPGRGTDVELRVSRAPRPSEWASRYASLIGASPKLHRVFHILDRIAPNDGTVLIHGESGTGKELVAEAIHRNSPRAKGPFVKLNCAALVESLLLSELFGHERGSFTGAHQRKIGRFEMAAGGTIFLDEIGDISPKTQVALLRVLQEREFERVGGGRPIKVEARILVATNRNLSLMVREGTFREDLYYRLKGLTIDLPPLRERPEDIIELTEHFLDQYALESGTLRKRLSRQATDLLLDYPWPGNVRELENIVRSVALFAESATIDARDFDEYRELFQDGPAWSEPSGAQALNARPPAPIREAAERGRSGAPAPGLSGSGDATQAVPREPLLGPRSSSAEPPQDLEGEILARIFAEGVPLPELKKRIQEQAIARALRMTRGNITRAAEVLGMRRPRLSQIINASEELKGLCPGVDR